ncbi:HIT domain-containing protein [Alkalihalobacillus sp. TS-13]|uniref:HIT domain-containing protein n=1 Tax=Alkalihalobacillus sp. TS-13 TaxID=2842455 RepID=UPI001C866F3E|nr:HIT domain-containing protein [Alkalihalobacillus sp. TS-13]
MLSGNTKVDKVEETDKVLAYHHTKPSYEVHIVAIPKVHIPSLTKIDDKELDIFNELMNVVRKVAYKVETDYGACRVITNLGRYQDSKHLHRHIISGDKI